MDTTSQSDVTTETAKPTSLSQSQLYSILSNRRRRYVVHYLKQADEPVTVRQVAEQVAAWENEKPKGELTSQERKRVYISLYQGHLSTLDTEGLVDYDSEQGIVAPTELLKKTNVYLEIVPPNSISWGQFYLGLTLANLALLGLKWYEIGILAEISTFTIAVLMLFSYAITAIVQILRTERLKLGEDGPPPDLRDTDHSLWISLDFDIPFR